MYELGYNPDIEKLYPPVQFPVSRGTPLISPIVKWEHSEDWFVLSYRAEDQPRVFSLKYRIDMRENEWSYLKGHVVDGEHSYCGIKIFVIFVLKLQEEICFPLLVIYSSHGKHFQLCVSLIMATCVSYLKIQNSFELQHSPMT